MQKHEIVRMRHETRRRPLTVQTVEAITPRMRRILFTSTELAGFVSPSPDDHVKLFLPSGPGVDAEIVGRDFTPRSFDIPNGSLVIDFALHESGPATQWAANAQPGDTLEAGGPRGSSVVPDDFDWYLLIGDEAALPSIGRRVESLRRGVAVQTVIAVPDRSEEQHFNTAADWQPTWVVRESAAANDPAPLREALEGLKLPDGEGFVWIAAETAVASSLYAYIVEKRHHPKEWVKAASYWEMGSAGAHGKIG